MNKNNKNVLASQLLALIKHINKHQDLLKNIDNATLPEIESLLFSISTLNRKSQFLEWELLYEQETDIQDNTQEKSSEPKSELKQNPIQNQNIEPQDSKDESSSQTKEIEKNEHPENDLDVKESYQEAEEHESTEIPDEETTEDQEDDKLTSEDSKTVDYGGVIVEEESNLNDKHQLPDSTVHSRLSSPDVSNLKKSIAMNDRFFYLSGLFDNNSDEFDQALLTFENCTSQKEAIQTLRNFQESKDWDESTKAYQKFERFIFKAFNIKLHE